MNRQFFERSSMEVAIDLGLRKLRFSREGRLHVPEKTKEVLIIQTIPYGTEGGYTLPGTAENQLRKSDQGGLRASGVIDMFRTPYGHVLAISTDQEGKYSEVSVHGGLPIAGFGEMIPRDLGTLLNGPIKLTRNLGIDRDIAKLLDGKPIHSNEFIEISDEKIDGSYRFDPKKISSSALGIFYFKAERQLK